MIENLVHYIYASAASAAFQEPDLPALLQQSRRNNQDVAITGMLLYSAGSFFQVLEGEPGRITKVLARIAADPRHERITSIINEPIARRSFAEWTMGFVTMQPQEIAELVGMNDFFGDTACLTQLDDGRTKKLLAAFAAGRWRARLRDATPRPAMEVSR